MLSKRFDSLNILKEIRDWNLIEYKYFLVFLTRFLSIIFSPNYKPFQHELFPNSSNVINWISVLLDSHFRGIVFEEEINSVILPSLQYIVAQQVSHLEDLSSLKNLTHGLLDNPFSQPQEVDYCLKFLQLWSIISKKKKKKRKNDKIKLFKLLANFFFFYCLNRFSLLERLISWSKFEIDWFDWDCCQDTCDFI